MSATITGHGRVVKEGEVKQVKETQVLNVRVAVDRGWGNNKQTDFFQLAIWGKPASSLAPMLVKGAYIFFTGQFATRAHEQNGEKRLALEVNTDRVELGPRSAAASDDRRAAEPAPTTNQGQQAKAVAAVTNAPDLDDEIPF